MFSYPHWGKSVITQYLGKKYGIQKPRQALSKYANLIILAKVSIKVVLRSIENLLTRKKAMIKANILYIIFIYGQHLFMRFTFGYKCPTIILLLTEFQCYRVWS